MPEGGYKWDTTPATEKGLRNIQKQTAAYDLDQIVREGQKDDQYKSGISSAGTVIAGMSKKKQDFINRNTDQKTGRMNSAAKSLLNFYWDDRSDYQRDLNTFIKSSPVARETYLERFPVGGRINLGIPAAFNALSKLAIPAPIRALGTMARDVATLGGRGLKALIPKGMRKDLGFEYNKLMKNFDPKQKANLGIVKDEQAASPVKKKIEDEGKTIGEIENDLANEILFGLDDTRISYPGDDTSQDIAYDPTQDVDTRISYPGVEDWMGEKEDIDIFDTSQNVMPHVPITREQKVKAVDEAYNWLPGASTDDLDWWLEENYNQMREAQEKGMERLPWEGVVNKYDDNPWDEWQYPDQGELVDQIRWNTANRPLDWSGGETPELTDDFIRKNLKTGSDLWSGIRDGAGGGGDRFSEFDVAELTQAQKDFMNRPEQSLDYQTKEQLWNKIMTPQGGYDEGFLGWGAQEPTTEEEFDAYLDAQTVAGGGYLKKFDDGGYANMSTFEKLKAINDSIAEG